MVADKRRDTAAAAALDTMVLNRRLVRSKGDKQRIGDERSRSNKNTQYMQINVISRLHVTVAFTDISLHISFQLFQNLPWLPNPSAVPGRPLSGVLNLRRMRSGGTNPSSSSPSGGVTCIAILLFS